MKKGSFVALIIGIIGLTCLGLGMSMILATAFGTVPMGVVLGIVGVVLCIISVVKACKAEHVRMPRPEGKIIKAILAGIVACVLLGIGLTLALTGGNMVLGIVLGVGGIIVGISIIPIVNGFTE